MMEKETVIDLTIALPAYEEATNLELLLPRINAVCKRLAINFEIVVADTEQPRDKTPEICEKFGAIYTPRIGGSLYSHAVKTAIQNSRGEWVVFMDADGSHNPEFIEKLWLQRNQADLIIASRYMPGGQTENPLILVWMSLIVNLVFRQVLGLQCADVSNSFRLYRGDDLRALSLECENFDIVEEILVKLCYAKDNFNIKEIPFVFEKRKAGKTKRNLLIFIISYIATLMKLARLKRQVLKKKKFND